MSTIDPFWIKSVPKTNTEAQNIKQSQVDRAYNLYTTKENSKVGIEESRKKLINIGCKSEGKFLVVPDAEVLAKLKSEVDKNFKDGALMPTLDVFYMDTLLAVSAMRQSSLFTNDENSIEYYPGKGWGVEIALLGNVLGRQKRNISFPYRSHSDFELYGMDFKSDKHGGKIDDEKTYTSDFKTIFGSQEIFSSNHTKGLKNLPEDLISKSATICMLGDIPIKIPELEILFLDKWIMTESTPRIVQGDKMYDAECLARQYVLDPKKCHEYLENYVIQPNKEIVEENFKKKSHNQITWLERQIKSYLQENGDIETAISELNDWAIPFMSLSIKPTSLIYWKPLTVSDLDDQNNLTENFIENLNNLINLDKISQLEMLDKKHEQLDELFAKIDIDYS